MSELPQLALFILGKQGHICGYNDYFFLLDQFPNSTLAILDQTGHLKQIEKRVVVQQLVKDLLCR